MVQTFRLHAVHVFVPLTSLYEEELWFTHPERIFENSERVRELDESVRGEEVTMGAMRQDEACEATQRGVNLRKLKI